MAMKQRIKVGVVMLVVSEFALALQALESIRTKYDWEPYIVDNWRENRGVTKGWNIGIKQAIKRKCSHILVLNDDVLVAPFSIDKIIEHWPDDYILVGLTHYNDISNDPTTNDFDESPDFGGFMITPKTIKTVGYFDENIFAWHEDNDMHRRINVAGYKAGRYHAAPYHHFKSVTTDQALNQDDRQKWFQDGADYYRRKWGGYVGNEVFSHPFNDAIKTVKDW